MKRTLFNLSFLFSFLIVFSVVTKIYYADFEEALSKESLLFPADESIALENCQTWTHEVRDFQLEAGEQADEISVLMYHRVIDEEDLGDIHYNKHNNLKSTIILKEDFEKQMQVLNDENYTTLTREELKLFLENKLDVPKKSIVITFDDGFKDNYTETYPILKKNGFTALNFIITGAISEKDSKYEADEYQYLSVSDIKNSCDVFDYQSHTYNFHKRAENRDAYLIDKADSKVKKDIKTSIKNLDGRKDAFAYPYGSYDEGVIKVLKELGFNMAFTTRRQTAKPGVNMYEIPRFEIFPSDTLETFKNKINLK